MASSLARGGRLVEAGDRRVAADEVVEVRREADVSIDVVKEASSNQREHDPMAPEPSEDGLPPIEGETDDDDEV